MHVGRPSSDVDEIPIRARGLVQQHQAAGRAGDDHGSQARSACWPSGEYTVAAGVFSSRGIRGTSAIRM